MSRGQIPYEVYLLVLSEDMKDFRSELQLQIYNQKTC